MDNNTVASDLQEMQRQADTMRSQFARMVTNRSLTPEQVAQADTRLENFREDLETLLSEIGEQKEKPVQDNNHIWGPDGHGDYANGDTITFTERGKTLSGEVIHCTKPGPTVSGRYLPLTYEVDCNDGWPHIVSSSQIVQQ